ncbi:uncharacterized protein HD556DRAFT_1440346 [Suillus plorans]|uniref:Uncharacterized protein n=1 Tax=Suillus plorans TaxID=116603 RepID=A0A9P7J0A7_9AGAM|nr:uncharacterized protein HD556DRAFT_1440346 [Suillus plorans]KAG1798647.1 hypothetical protein HD556DRAFT_1440346 [Suillus plorans]
MHTRSRLLALILAGLYALVLASTTCSCLYMPTFTCLFLIVRVHSRPHTFILVCMCSFLPSSGALEKLVSAPFMLMAEVSAAARIQALNQHLQPPHKPLVHYREPQFQPSKPHQPLIHPRKPQCQSDRHVPTTQQEWMTRTRRSDHPLASSRTSSAPSRTSSAPSHTSSVPSRILPRTLSYPLSYPLTSSLHTLSYIQRILLHTLSYIHCTLPHPLSHPLAPTMHPSGMY